MSAKKLTREAAVSISPTEQFLAASQNAAEPEKIAPSACQMPVAVMCKPNSLVSADNATPNDVIDLGPASLLMPRA
jgi:hypothetical protein